MKIIDDQPWAKKIYGLWQRLQHRIFGRKYKLKGEWKCEIKEEMFGCYNPDAIDDIIYFATEEIEREKTVGL